MAIITWRQNPAVAEALSRQVSEFEFDQAITILEQEQQNVPIGEGSDPSREAVEIKSYVSLANPSTELYKLQQKPGKKATLWVNFLSLAGIQGPLPTPYTEVVLQRNRQKDFAFRDFLDIFNHRLAGLWFRFRRKYRIGLSNVTPEKHPVGKTLLQLAGIQNPDNFSGNSTSQRVFLTYNDLLWRRPHSAAGLLCFLKSYFQVPASLDLFQGQWRQPKPEELSLIGNTAGRYQVLGQSLILGQKVWDQAASILITFGPLSWSLYQSFLPLNVKSKKSIPNGFRNMDSKIKNEHWSVDNYREREASTVFGKQILKGEGYNWDLLNQMCKLYVGYEVDLHLQLILDSKEVKPLALNRHFALGLNSWLAPLPSTDRKFTVSLNLG